MARAPSPLLLIGLLVGGLALVAPASAAPQGPATSDSATMPAWNGSRARTSTPKVQGGGSPADAPPPAPAAPPSSGAGSGVPPAGADNGPPTSTGTAPLTSAPDVTGASSQPPARHPWIAWWELSKGAYVQPKHRVRFGGVTTGSADYFLGQGTPDARAPEARRVDPARVANDIVPALIQQLEVGGGPEPVVEALLALGRVSPALSSEGFGPVLNALQGQLRLSSNRTVAEAAAIGLGLSGHDAAVPVLAATLLAGPGRSESGPESPARLRAFAAYGLALLARDSEREDVRRYAVATLSRALAASERSEPEVPIACILGLGLVPLERIVVQDAGGVPEPASASRVAIVRELGATLAARRGPRQDVRAHVPLAFGRMAGDLPADRFEELKPWLAEPLLERAAVSRRESSDMTRGLALALGTLVDTDADPLDVRLREALLDLADSGELGTRNEALLAIGEAAVRNGSGSSPGVAREALGRRLIHEIDRGRVLSRPFALSALALAVRGVREQDRVPPSTWIAALERGLRDASSPEDLVSACVAIGLAGETSLTPAVEQAFARTPAGWFRAQVALALGLLGQSTSRGLLREFADEASQRPRDLRAAAEALLLTGDPSHVTEMIADLSGASASQAQALAYALGALGEPQAVGPLLALLRSPSASSATRAAAIAALGRIADPRSDSPLQRLADGIVPVTTSSALFGLAALEAALEDSPAPSAFLRGGGILNLVP